MGIFGLGRRPDHRDPTAAEHLASACGDVDQRYQAVASLPFDEAVEAVWRMTPGGLTRDEVAHRLRGARPADADGASPTTDPRG